MKTIKSLIVVFIIALIGIGSITLTNQTVLAPEETTVLAFTTDEKEDVKVSEVVLDTIQEEVNITSKSYEFSFLYEKGTLNESASVSDKLKHALAGKSIIIDAYLKAELKSNLLNISANDIVFNEQEKSLFILLPTPTFSINLDKRKTMVNDSYEAIFSSGFSDKEQLRMYYEIELLGENKFLEEEAEIMEQAKQDIINGLMVLLKPIDSVDKIVIDFKGNQF